jgi:hypothetical protein
MKRITPYWEMTTAELRRATRKFDTPDYQPVALPQTPEDVAQQRRAKNKRGGPGGQTILLTVEKSLLARSDAYAKQLGISRAELIQRGLNAVLPARGRKHAG